MYPGTYYGSNQCLPCHNYCEECTGPLPTECTKCKSIYNGSPIIENAAATTCYAIVCNDGI